jgi:hypothetical protein
MKTFIKLYNNLHGSMHEQNYSRSFSTSPDYFNSSYSNKDTQPSLMLDNSDNKDSIILKIYKNVYINKVFDINMGAILDDLYDIVDYGYNKRIILVDFKEFILVNYIRLRGTENNLKVTTMIPTNLKKNYSSKEYMSSPNAKSHKATKIEQEIKHKNHIDILARLITSQHSNKNKKDVCVAICSHNKKLFIASNKNKPEYSKECLIDLQELLKKNNSVKSYEKLLKKAVEKIRYIKLKSKSSSKRTLLEVHEGSNVILKEFKEKARECSESKNPD